ncbi:hypothetical protein BC827DRAFT_264599, partial [Russula dissimulans]
AIFVVYSRQPTLKRRLVEKGRPSSPRPQYCSLSDLCIPANPDISGIGVRTANYAQNFLCFAPVVAYLWHGKISIDGIKGIKGQSIGMLAIAFAIIYLRRH